MFGCGAVQWWIPEAISCIGDTILQEIMQRAGHSRDRKTGFARRIAATQCPANGGTDAVAVAAGANRRLAPRRHFAGVAHSASPSAHLVGVVPRDATDRRPTATCACRLGLLRHAVRR